MEIPSISTSSVPTRELCLKRQQEDWYASTRSSAMYGLTFLFVAIAFALFVVSLLPQATIPFAGAYFVIGIFLFFIALGILFVNFACQLIHLCRRTKVIPPTELPTSYLSHNELTSTPQHQLSASSKQVMS